MAKLLILLATAFAALLLADASIYRATVVIEDEANPKGMDCMQQFQQQQKLMHCQEYMRYKMRQSQRGMNPSAEEHLRMCCNQLQNMDSHCRCESLEYAMKDMMQSAGQQMKGMQEMRSVAQQIPMMCKMSPGQCHFGPQQLISL